MAVKRVTLKMAQAVILAIDKQWGVDPMYGGGPSLMEDWDGHDFVVIWEGGPFEWPLFVSGGGFDEWGNEYKPTKLPSTVWTEPVNGCVLAIYRT